MMMTNVRSFHQAGVVHPKFGLSHRRSRGSRLSYSINDDKESNNDPSENSRKQQQQQQQQQMPEGSNPRESEFSSLEPRHDTVTRRKRIHNEKEAKRTFASFGDDLWDLRASIKQSSQDLMDSIISGGQDDMIRDEIIEMESRDADFVYQNEVQKMNRALREGNEQEADECREKALNARNFLPQFNFEGLWIGKYGNHGFEMINITYVGDILLAEKITGDQNVPAGEISFQADLSPPEEESISFNSDNDKLPNIELSPEAAKRWGTKELSRHAGLGLAAEENFVNSQWMEGQLIIINEDHFSFSWTPLNHQVFFGRPSPELTLKMLREQKEVNFKNLDYDQVEHLSRCYDVTIDTLDEDKMEGKDEFSCIFYGDDDDECYFE